MVSISGTSFSFNNATETGGALYLEALVTGHIDNCRFLNNTSPVGGALSLASADDGREFSVFGCNFTGNTASVGAGGAIIQQGSATVLSVNYISITGLTLPLQYLQFLRAVDFMSLDMRWLTSPGCAADVDFYGRLLIATLAPLVITALIFSPRLYLRFISRRRPAVAPKLRQVVARDVNAFLVFTFLIFSGVSLTVFETFACDKHLKEFTGDIYLHADYSLRCNDDEGLHKKYSIYAGFMVVVYPVGIPLMYAAILRLAAVKQREHGRQPSRLAPASSFLWSSYKGRACYWESVECFRRLMLSGLLVFIMPGTPGQSAVACIFAFVTTMVYEQVRPHHNRMDKWLYTLGCVIVVSSMFTSLLMQYHPVDGGSEQAIGSLLIALNVLMLVMAIAQVALVYTNVRAPDGPLRQNSVFGLFRGSSQIAARSLARVDSVTPSPMS
ncbi:hypothetical protein JKP88DRAFT_195774 [Tribonema minus]|uniref:Uncharacterized protein n=1 Tax=Tribonema minus TaxID=303371 RepID=A0A836CGF3_9STRA|nr:hypothetical protein JKP88DRAFT_195774 [Tribonema minus]